MVKKGSMNRPLVGVAVFVIKEGKFLIGKRKSALAYGTLALPGGHLEFGESFEECARREVFEETGIQIKNIIRATITNDLFVQENKQYITIFMVAEYDSGIVQTCEPDKCEGWDWVAWKEMPLESAMLSLKNLTKEGFDLQNYL